MTSEQIHIGNMSHETAIGILKLMLEAMETYDGISPTPARINAIKMAIEALEQEPILDKIRAEIEQLTIDEGGDDYVRKMAELFSLKMKVLQIIDKYKADTEAEE